MLKTEPKRERELEPSWEQYSASDSVPEKVPAMVPEMEPTMAQETAPKKEH